MRIFNICHFKDTNAYKSYLYSDSRIEKIKKNLDSPSEIGLFHYDIGGYHLVSRHFTKKYINESKTFIIGNNYTHLHTFRDNGKPGEYPYTSHHLPAKSEILSFYNENGYPIKCLTEKGMLTHIALYTLGWFDEFWKQEQSPMLSQQELSQLEKRSSYSPGAFLEVFDNAPLDNDLFNNLNFVFCGYSNHGKHDAISHWARRNGLKNKSSKPRKHKIKNVIVNFSNMTNEQFYYGGADYAKTHSLDECLTISLKTLINVAYSYNYKKGFSISLEALKKAREEELLEVWRIPEIHQEYDSPNQEADIKKYIDAEMNKNDLFSI
jgi:hypothetical protein